MPGDRVIGSRLSYTFGEPERGDIAIFVYPDDAYKGITTYYVKRVIGMPGDTIDIIDGKSYINVPIRLWMSPISMKRWRKSRPSTMKSLKDPIS